MFQSIYTYKRRWNFVFANVLSNVIIVSIHLYLQEALESSTTEGQRRRCGSFNPFIPTRGVGIELLKLLPLYHPCFNPFIPTRGVGITDWMVIAPYWELFQSIYTYKRRWNTFLRLHRKGHQKRFQSIYTYKRRWNWNTRHEEKISNIVSIHLYLQEALELSWHTFISCFLICFNPFIPTRGVGIEDWPHTDNKAYQFQSIYTYKRRWNNIITFSISTLIPGFNPFIPTRGVGINFVAWLPYKDS